MPGTPEERDHLESCPSCAAWLDSEHRLTASLTHIARELAEASPAPRVEAALVAAFRNSTEARGAPERQPTSFRRVSFWLPATLATATTLAVFVSLRLASVPEGASGGPGATTPGLALPSAAALTPPASPRLSSPPRTRVARAAIESPRRRRSDPPTATVEARATSLGSADAGLDLADFGPLAPGIVVLADAPESMADDPFVPLGFVDTPVLLEGGQVLQVELSPETARSAGLTVDSRAGPSPIRADVVVGHDGVARAIRLIGDRQ